MWRPKRASGSRTQDPCKALPCCYLQITILLNSLVYPSRKKFIWTLDVRYQKKWKKIQESGCGSTVTSTCDRDRSLLMSMGKISPPHRYYRYINKLLKRLWTRQITGWLTMKLTKPWTPKIFIDLLLAEFSVRTVNYRPTFFPSTYGPSAKRVGHKLMEKNEANKMFIIWFLPVWGTGNKCRTSAGRAIWQSFDRCQEIKCLLVHENNSTQQRVSEKVKTNSPCWKSLFGQN